MIEQLFGSKTRVKLLQLFYQNPNRSYYVREITRKIDEQINSVRRELSNLLSIGIITSDSTNNKLYYEVSQDFEYYGALANIFGGAKLSSRSDKKSQISKKEDQDKLGSDDLGSKEPVESKIQIEGDPFVQGLAKTGNVRLALYTGQFTRDNIAGIDIVIVGDVNESSIENLVKELEKTEKKELRYSIFTTDEYGYREQVNDRFVSNVKDAKKVILIDKDNRF